jgi:hypothetical protein
VNEPRNPPKPPGPAVRDWVLFAISLTFVLMGLFIAQSEPLEALFPLTFFGVCAITFAYIIARKLRRRRFTAISVAVPGGVKLGGSNSRMLLLAAMIGIPGIAIFLVPDSPLLVRICAVIMLGSSAALILGVLTGRISRRFLRFDPTGITIGETKFEYMIPWDEIVDIAEFEMHDNAVVGFNILRTESIQVTPESARERVLKSLGSNLGIVNRHVMIMPFHFGAHAESLCAAIRNYAGNREARADLVTRPALTAPSGRR